MLLYESVYYLGYENPIWQYYHNEQVPTEVRQNLAVWIEVFMLESSQGPAFSLDHPQQQAIGGLAEFYNGFKEQIRLEADNLRQNERLLDHLTFHEFLLEIEEMGALALYSKLQRCLTEELHCVQQQQQGQMPQFGSQDVGDISSNIGRLFGSLGYWQKFTELMNQVSQKIILNAGNNILINQLGRFKFRSWIHAHSLVTNLETLINSLVNNGGFLHKLKWSCTSTPPPDIDTINQNLETVQGWFTNLFDLIWFFDQNAEEHQQLCQDDPNMVQQIQQLRTRVQGLQIILLQHSLQVQIQPCQVLMQRRWDPFTAKFAFQQSFIVYQIPQEVTINIYIVNDARAQGFFNATTQALQNPGQPQQQLNMELYSSGELDEAQIIRAPQDLDNTAHEIRITRATRSFPNPQLREKMCFVLHTSFVFQNRDIESWCCTNPFVYTVNSNQWEEAWGTIFWDNYFRQEGRIPFQVPDQVPWPFMAWALSEYFKTTTRSNWGLTPTNLAYLCQKLLDQQPNDNAIVTRHRFDMINPALWEVKDGGQPKNKSFWKWFYRTTAFSAKYISPIWGENLGLIVGFIDRVALEDNNMQGFQPGSFSLRFCEEAYPGISICYVRRIEQEQGQENSQVVSLLPLRESDLSHRSLNQRLYDLMPLERIVWVDHNGNWNESPKNRNFIPLPDLPANAPVLLPHAIRPYAPWAMHIV